MSGVYRVWVTLALVLLLAGCVTTPTVTEPTATKPAPLPSATPIPSEKVRPAMFAGLFYPADRGELQRTVDDFLAQVQPTQGTPIVLMVPHAGYTFSGPVAAYAYRQIQGVSYDAIVVIGNNHSVADFSAVSIYSEGAFATPLGEVPVDEALAKALLDADETGRLVAEPRVHYYEHSIEVQLPFLQRAHPGCKIVPIMMGQPTAENCEALSKALVKVLAGRQALIIVSSDMAHYPTYNDAVRVDNATLSAICSMDPQAVLQNDQRYMSAGIPNLVCTLCGLGPVLTGMMVARELGANEVTVLKYANSGDVPAGESNLDRVVGYSAVMFWHWNPPNFTPEQKAELLALARRTLERYLTEHEVPVESPLEYAMERCGVFVTLTRDGQLRGCIGRVIPHEPLYHTIQECTVLAATEDQRFPPVSVAELGDIRIEISVLSPLHPLNNIGEIQIGRDGLAILHGEHFGLLLPQVPVQEGWDRDEYLRALCRKAGLPEDAWAKGATLYRFTAEVFGESE
ncbi:MAG: AmmeMemoRadiSam system protein B [Chloroflexi bacterium]|nr:AmmeMemoRadiSam system protein B [Chloroflexota bacterium]